MAEKEKKQSEAGLQLIGIELLNSSLQLPPLQGTILSNFSFDLKVESNVDSQKKLVFVIVHVEIKTEDLKHVLGTLSLSCIYTIVNFEEVVKVSPEGKITLPPSLNDLLNSISISTTRGVMFSTFKGTFIHSAFLPIVDPRAFQQIEKV